MVADEGVPARRRIVQRERYDPRCGVAERAWQHGQASTPGAKPGLHLAVVAAAGDGRVRQQLA